MMVLNGLPFQSFEQKSGMLWFKMSSDHLEYCVENRIIFFSISGWSIDFDYCDIEWFALEMDRGHSVIFEIAPKYCISDSFFDYEGYSISSLDSCPQ